MIIRKRGTKKLYFKKKILAQFVLVFTGSGAKKLEPIRKKRLCYNFRGEGLACNARCALIAECANGAKSLHNLASAAAGRQKAQRDRQIFRHFIR
jgi:hypothetical protein